MGADNCMRRSFSQQLRESTDAGALKGVADTDSATREEGTERLALDGH